MNELGNAFADVVNYESDDPLSPVNPLTYRTPEGDTCLHIAAGRGDLRSIELLLKAGLNIDNQGDMGTTPLHCAKNEETAKFLVKHGAAQNIRDEFGRLPLEVTREPSA
jgi:ankyrin repeat protein